MKELIDNLSDKEIESLNSVLKSVGKERLSLLMKNPALIESDRKRLFKLTYGKDWTSQKDYQLRNDLRALKNEIRRFLAKRFLDHNSPEAEYLTERLYLKELNKRGAGSYYISEKSGAMKGDSTERWGHELNDRIEWVYEQVQAAQNAPLPIDEIVNETLNLKEQNGLNHTRRLMRIECLHAYLCLLGKRLNLQMVYPIDSCALMAEVNSDPATEFFRLKTLSFAVAESERLNVIEQMEALLTKAGFEPDEHNRELAGIMANLSLEYGFQFDFERALKCSDKTLTLKKYITPITYLQVMYNHMALLLKKGDNAMALSFYRANQQQISRDSALKFKFDVLHVAAHIFLGQLAEARIALPNNIKQGDFDEYLYIRCLTSMIYYEAGKYDLAEREVTNMQKTLTRNNKALGGVGFRSHKRFIQLMTSLLEVADCNPDAMPTDVINNLRVDHAELVSYTRQSIIPLIWALKKAQDKVHK